MAAFLKLLTAYVETMIKMLFIILGAAPYTRTLVRKCENRKLCCGTEIDYIILEVLFFKIFGIKV
jgi:hypothetical protein